MKSNGFCTGHVATVFLVTLMAAGTCLGRAAAETTAATAKPHDGLGERLDALVERSDAAAPMGETASQARERRTLLLDMVAQAPRCFVANPTPEQMEYIMQHFNALPVGGVLQDGLNNRFFTSNLVWTGNGGQGASGRATPASLRFSFPNDGVSWDGGSNNLNSKFNAQFGTANIDRGREYVRQALASWRRYSGLSYTEVADNNSPFTGSAGAAGGGEVRIGSRPQGNTGVLAYNYFPNGGSDMVINSDELNTGSMFGGSSNFRYFRNVVAHEHGHGLGFIHTTPCNGTKLMEPFANTNFEMTQVDELRGAQRNYGDRFAGNNSAGSAKDFGDLTSPVLKSIIERSLSTNGAAGINNTNQDWFKFTLSSAQNVTITVVPTGGSYANGQQSGGCNPTSPPAVNASAAGNLDVELRDSNGSTVLLQANSAAAGATESIPAGSLSAGTYTVRVIDSGPDGPNDQIVQLYDLTIRVGNSKAPPTAIAGVNKRVAAGQVCYFMGNLNSRTNESGAILNNASYDWDLDGNGVFETLDNPQPTFTYNSNGLFNVTLRVTDSNGMSATDTISVAVVGAVSSISSVTPNTGQSGATIPVTITGVNLAGVSSASQVTVSGGGVTVTGTPVISGGGSTVNGLSFVIGAGAAVGSRNVTISNADGTGQVATANGVFSVTNTPPANDDCAAPISWGSVAGPRPFTNTNATTGLIQSFPGTGCPAAGPINQDVWYTWVAPANGNLNVTTDSATAGSPTPFSSRVAVYHGGNCPPGAAVGCDDFGSSFNVFVQDGHTYLFQIGSIIVGQTGTADVILTFTPVVGACCDSSGGCTITASSECLGTSTFSGNGTTCEVPGCEQPLGTCCAADGGCTVSDQSGCSTGTFAPGDAVCNPNPCPQPTGACCSALGGCVMSEQADCDAGRAWTSGGVCDPNPCPEPTGACCATDGTCIATTAAGCSDNFLGAGSTCSPNQCPQPTGACCATDGACNIATTAGCSDSFMGVGSACSPNPCPQPTGACCNGTTCTVATAADCSGAFVGAGSACGGAGNPVACCPANFNQQGGVTVQDIFDFLAAYFGGQPGADFNSSGGITVQDIFDFLGAYFTGCPG